MTEENLTCRHSDKDSTSLICGHPLPCPHHTIVLNHLPEKKRLDDYQRHLRRKEVVEEFFKSVENTAIDKVFDGSLEPAIALLVTFMEWQEMRKE